MRGYTLVELLIAIAIIALLITYSLSAFVKAQDRQTVSSAKEAVLAALQKAQKAAYVGDKDCDGALIEIRVTFSNNTISSQARCATGDGSVNSVVLSNLSFTTSPTINFKPLEQGVSFGGGGNADIDYLIGTKTYRVTVSSPGTITYIGEI